MLTNSPGLELGASVTWAGILLSRATNPICAQPLSPATVRLSSKGQKTNPGGISDSIQIMALATRNLLSRAGEAVSCPELGHRLKKDRSVAPSAL